MTDSPQETPQTEPAKQPAPAQAPDVLGKIDAPTVSQEIVPPEPVIEYPVYNHEVADSIVNTLKSHKVKPEDAQALFLEAVQARDISKLDTKALEKLVGKDSTDLIALRLERFFTEELATKDKIVTSIYETMGSKEITDTVIQWAKVRAKGSPEFSVQYQEYVKMLDAGPVQAKLAAKELKAAYEADPDNSSLGVQMTQGDKSASTQSTPQELTRSSYLEAIKKANAEGNIKEYERLRALRAQSLNKTN